MIIHSGNRFSKDRIASPVTNEGDKDDMPFQGMQLIGRSSSLYQHEQVLGAQTPAKVDAASMTFSVDEINGQLRSFELQHFLTDTKILTGQSEMNSPRITLPAHSPKQRYKVLKVTDYDLT